MQRFISRVRSTGAWRILLVAACMASAAGCELTFLPGWGGAPLLYGDGCCGPYYDDYVYYGDYAYFGDYGYYDDFYGGYYYDDYYYDDYYYDDYYYDDWSFDAWYYDEGDWWY